MLSFCFFIEKMGRGETETQSGLFFLFFVKPVIVAIPAASPLSGSAALMSQMVLICPSLSGFVSPEKCH